jgi:hypothetical protein
MPKFEPGKLEFDPKQEKVCNDVAEKLRKYALDRALELPSGQPATADMVIDSAIKIEAYLRGELASPNDL